MDSAASIQQKIDSLTGEESEFEYQRLRNQLQRATLSEEFKKNVLPAFLRTAKECVEKADESFFITLQNGRKFVYYCSKASLVELLSKGRKGKRFYVPPHKFLRHMIDTEHGKSND